MPFSLETVEATQVLKLEGAVTIRYAEALAALLSDIPDDCSALEVDTLGLEDIDTCILQVLCSLRKTVSVVSFHKSSEIFCTAVSRCGLGRELTARLEGQ